MNPTSPRYLDDDLQSDPLLAQAFAEAAQSSADGLALDAAQTRSWQAVAKTLQGAPVAPLSDCADFRQRFPAALAGQLDPAGRLLLDDHLKGCADCRRTWREARGLAPAAQLHLAPAAAGRRFWPARRAWSLAAALLLALGVGGLATGWIQPSRVLAQVQSWQRQLSQELARLRADLNALPRPELRRSSALASQLPADTLVFAALPNLSGTMTEADTLLRQRIQESPVLKQWWEQHLGDARAQAERDAVIREIGRWGAHLGDEVIVGMGPGRPDARGVGSVGAPVILAALKDEAAFRQALAAYASQPREAGLPTIQLLPDAAALGAAVDREVQASAAADSQADTDAQADSGAPAAPAEDLALAWIQDRKLFLSPSAAALATWQRAAAAERFGSTALYAELAKAYEGGVNTLIGIDLEGLAALQEAARTAAGAAAQPVDAGSKALEGARHLIVVERSGREGVDLRAELSYREKPEGHLAWLAAPTELAALDYLSPDAHLAMAGVAQAPETLLARAMGAGDPTDTGSADDQDAAADAAVARSACSQLPAVLENLAAGASGEFAWGLDGPVLPKPAWVLAIKVKDEARLRAGLDGMLDCLAQAPEGEGVKVTRTKGSLAGRTLESLQLEPAPGQTAPSGPRPAAIHFLVDDGYLVAASEPGVLGRALKTRASGVSLKASSAFRKQLPAGDDGADFQASGLLYQNLAEVAQPLAQVLGDRAEGAVPPGQAPSPQGQEAAPGADSAAALAELPEGLLLVEALEHRLVIRGQADGAGLGDLLTGFGFLGRESAPRPFPQTDL